MMCFWSVLFFSVLAPPVIRSQPLPPAWSPDHRILATTKVPQDFITPEGGNYSVLFNGQLVYPIKPKRHFADFYAGWHTILSDFVWAPDSGHVAFLEKVYDWQYSDPFNMYWDGRVSNQHFYLVVVSRDGKAQGYKLPALREYTELEWRDNANLAVNGQDFNIASNPPQSIP